MHRIFTIALIFTCSNAFGGISPGTWNVIDSPTRAFGNIDGIQITATTNEAAPFIGIVSHRFANVNIPCGGWDIDSYSLEPSALGLTTSYVNGGDAQSFDFDAPWAGGYFYIENFDSSSLAKITVTGGATLEMLAGSESISFASISDSMGELSTTNAGFNGEGDAVFRLDGPVTSVLVDYSQGEQANGIFYGFASDTPMGAIPEPASIGVWGCLIGILVVAKRRFQGRK